MATKIEVGLGKYLIDFTNGQAAFRVLPYTQYQIDLDVNFVTLQTTINQLIDEVNAVQGPNASLGIDILTFDRPGRSGGTLLSGLVGIDSFGTTISSGDVVVSGGTVVINGTKVSNGAGGTFDAAAIPDGSAFVAIDLNGALSLSTTASSQDLDLYSVTVAGGAASSPVRLADVFFDGDEYELLRDRPATGGFAAKDFDQAWKRIDAIERVLSGLSTDVDTAALPTSIRLRDGSAGTPSLVLANSLTTGWFRQASGVWGFSASGSEVLRLRSAGLRFAITGSLGAPVISRTGDPNTGPYFPAADTYGWQTGGVLRGQFDPEGNLDLPTNSRVKGLRTASQSITDASATLIDFNAADAFDIGTWHDHASGTLSDRQEFTAPTGSDGTYDIVLNFEWADPTNLTDFLIEITVNGSPLAEKVEHDSERNFAGQLATTVALAAGDVVRARVTQNDTVGAAALDLEYAALTIKKVA